MKPIVQKISNSLPQKIWNVGVRTPFLHLAIASKWNKMGKILIEYVKYSELTTPSIKLATTYSFYICIQINLL